jgi:RimJ/RimL family protein N-acetyltransferase
VIKDVPSTRVETYAAAFPGPHAAMVIASIAAGNTAAQLWEADQPAAGAVVLLWDKGNNVFYLAGNPASDAIRRDLAYLVAARIRPAALAEGRAHFKARAISPSSEEALAQIFGEIALKEAHTLFYAFTNVQPNVTVAPTVDGIRFTNIDRAFLTDENLEHITHVRSEIRWMWLSEERFCEQGLGVAAVVEERVICWCTAEYVSTQRCGIGIATDPAYERRGVATATAARFVREAQWRGLMPYWECGSWNIASIRVAEKVGFERIAEERYWIGAFEE